MKEGVNGGGMEKDEKLQWIPYESRDYSAIAANGNQQ